MKPGSWVILISLSVMSACGESEPQFVGTAHMLRVLEQTETRQADIVERLQALEASVGEAVTSSMSDVPLSEKVISAPVITKLEFSSSIHDGLYKSGDRIRLIVTFSEPVVVDSSKGEPVILLETGEIDQYAKYILGSKTPNLIFEYMVQPKDSSFVPPREYQHQRLGLMRGAHTVDWSTTPLAYDIVIKASPGAIRGVHSFEDAILSFSEGEDNSSDPLRHANRVLVDGSSPIHWKYHMLSGNNLRFCHQPCSPQFLVETSEAVQVFALDLDKDYDNDILSASVGSPIVWHENKGNKFFQSYEISDILSTRRTVQAADIDSDGDTDVLVGGRSRIEWLENTGNKNFISHEIRETCDPCSIINPLLPDGTDLTPQLEVTQVFPADLDGDGDQDIIATMQWPNIIAWYENMEITAVLHYGDTDSNDSDCRGACFAEHIISDDAGGPHDVFVTDFDFDSDSDLVTASFSDHTIAWYENDGSQRFTRHIVNTSALSTTSVYPIDLDKDGDVDILADSSENDAIIWYENQGEDSFTPHNITVEADRAYSVFPIDLDNDGDIDVLSASSYDHKIAWYENDGMQEFLPHIITTQAVHASSVYAIDLDNDGDIDVVSSSRGDSSITWYENRGY